MSLSHSALKICRDSRLTDAYAYGFSVCLFASVIKMSKLFFATLGSALLPSCIERFPKCTDDFPRSERCAEVRRTCWQVCCFLHRCAHRTSRVIRNNPVEVGEIGSNKPYMGCLRWGVGLTTVGTSKKPSGTSPDGFIMLLCCSSGVGPLAELVVAIAELTSTTLHYMW